MNLINVKCQRVIALICFAAVGLIGTIDLGSRREYGVETEQAGKDIIISSVKTGSNAETAGIQVGDKLLSVDNRMIVSRVIAKWMLKEVRPGPPVIFQVERSGAIYQIPVTTEPQFHIIFVVLNTLLGLVFVAVGMMVWWSGNRDPIVRSFFRLNSLAGIAILLFGHENTFQPIFLHEIYAFIWLLTYCLTPAALVEFLVRLVRQSRLIDHHRALYYILYLPAIIAFAALSYSYYRAYSSIDPSWTVRYDTLFYTGFSLLLLAYFLAGIIVLGYNYLRPINRAEKDRVRWLLICTIVGLAPFFVLYKAPTLFGLAPFIPLWATFGLMLIVPIGWGMSVASFRMLKTEWVLSRTIIYTIAVGFILYLMLTSTLISFDYFKSKETTSLVVLIAVGLIVIFLAVLGLIGQIRRVIDRIYYHDWYNYRNAMRDLGIELSGSIDEKTIVHILTEQLPSILKIEKSTLLVKWQDETWRVPVKAAPLSNEKVREICGVLKSAFPGTSIRCDRDRLPSASTEVDTLGYQIILPLIHTGETIGILLLGRKLSGAPFSIRDHSLLDMLSSYAGTALANQSLTRKLLDNEKRAVAVDMAAGVAHEISNALSPLMGQAQLIEISLSKSPATDDRSKLNQRVNIIVEMCHRIKRIAQNLCKISEPLRLEVSQLSLNSVIEETLLIMTETTGRIKRFKENEPEAKFRLRKELDSKLPFVMGDRQQLSQVFINLIINASDAMESLGQGVLTVGTRFAADQSAAVAFVADTGIGIPQQHLDKVFQPYFTTKSEGKGSGLGLAIVRSIIEAHGGQLTIHSSEGHGTRVEFSLPISHS